jgi:hypothetical protein
MDIDRRIDRFHSAIARVIFAAMHVLSTLAYHEHGGVMLFVSGTVRPSEEHWQRYLDFVRSHIRNLRGAPMVAIIVARGEAPSSSQRKALAELTEAYPIRVAALVDGMVARGVVTALSWFNPGYAVFAVDDWQSAERHLGLSSALTAQLRDQVAIASRRLKHDG